MTEQTADSNKPVRASHKGLLPIAGLEIPCYVLEDGTRLITQRGMQKTIGVSTSGGTDGAHRLARIVGKLEAKALEEGILTLRTPLEALAARIYQPRIFLPPTGGLVAYGQEATTLIDLCELILKCRDADILTDAQEAMAVAADVVIRAFAKVGIIAVIDEVTGYQEVRDRDELQKILAAYISPQLMPYTSRFPPEFFEEMFRLRGWPYRRLSSGKASIKGPRYAGKLTNELIYKKLPPGVEEELKRKNPVINEKSQRRYKNYRFLTEDIGDPHLTKQVAVVTTLMKISPNWRTFERHFERAFPSPKTPIQDSLFDNDEAGEEDE